MGTHGTDIRSEIEHMTGLGEKTAFRQAALVLAAALLLTACTSGDSDKAAPNPAQVTGIEQTAGGEAPDIRAEFDTSREQNLLNGTWQYMKGVQQEDGALTVRRTGEAILLWPDEWGGEKTPEYVPDPPINLYGTHVEIANGQDIGLTASASDVAGSATFAFHSKPPVRYDERIVRHPGLDITVEGSLATVLVYGRPGEAPLIQELPLDAPAGAVNIVVIQNEQGLGIEVNGQSTEIAAPLFDDQIWFGMDSSGSFRLDELKAYPMAETGISLADTSQAVLGGGNRSAEGLASKVASGGRGDLQIGTAVELGELLSNPQYAEFVVQNFDAIETEIAGKFQTLQPEEGRFEFAELDALVDFANRNDLEVHGHALVFGEAYPQWLYDRLESANPSEAREIMRTHITTVMERYNGQNGHGEIKLWDVVNEPFDPDNWSELNQNNIWYRAYDGPGYIADAMKFAREANPDAMLGINEWGMETDDDRWVGMVGLVKSLTAMGAKPDYVGFQAHIDQETLRDEDAMDRLRGGLLLERFALLAGLGVKARISEISVAGNGNPELQAEIYGLAAEAVLLADNSIGLNLWGAANSELSYAYFTGDITARDPGDDAPVLQTPDGTIVPRPAWNALLRTAAP